MKTRLFAVFVLAGTTLGVAAHAQPTPPAGGGGGKPPPAGSNAPPPNTPSKEVEQLGDAGIRGLMVIESSPQGATIYLDGKEKGPFGTTPWSGAVAGEHTISIEKRGYKVAEKRLAADPSKLTVLSFVIAEEDYLGWLEIKSNVPGADIFLDDKAVGAIGKTPY